MNISLLAERAKYFETYISTLTSQEYQQARLAEAMSYSLFAGGKRLRPVLCMTCAKLCGLDITQVMNFATAIEMIHTYSLIHDDLPCMDNDDLRRGKPTCHKVYGEAMALLAGDALLADAVSQMLKTQLEPTLVLAAIQEIMLASGSKGMVSGQAMDMDLSGHTNFSGQAEDLIKMHSLKTGALLKASCTSGAILAGANQKQIASLNDFGLAFGLAFQITDDILDITGSSNELGKNIGSDSVNQKASYPNILGLDKSIELAKQSVKKAQASLEDFLTESFQGEKNRSEDAYFLRDLTEYLLTRKS